MNKYDEIKKIYEEAEINKEKNYDRLCTILKSVDCMELLSKISIEHYLSFLGEETVIVPWIIEYLACLCIALNHNGNDMPSEDDYKEVLALCENLENDEMTLRREFLLQDDGDIKRTKKNEFIARLKDTYAFTRGYSWYRKIEEEKLVAIFKNYEEKLKKIIGFVPQDVFCVTDAYAHMIAESKTGLEDTYKTILFVDREELFGRCDNLEKTTFDSIINFFSCDLSIDNMDKMVCDYTDDNYFSYHPIIVDGEKVCMPNFQIIHWNMRECIEDRIKQNDKDWSYYDKKCKAKYLEEKSAEIIHKLLPQCKIYNSLYYKPEEEKSSCELDSLVMYDNVIILVEAKSGAYSKPARRGGIKRLETVVEKNIDYAFEQARRTRQYISDEKIVHFYYDAELTKEAVTFDSSEITEVFIVNTTLDYYAELGLEFYKLKEFDIYKHDEYPWTVCISDLEVISDFVDFPNQFLYYLYFRREYNKKVSEESNITALYELDLFALYKYENTDLFIKYDVVKAKDDAGINEGDIFAKDYSRFYKAFYDEYYIKKRKPDIIKKKYNERFLMMCRQLERANKKGFSYFVIRFLDWYLDEQDKFIKEIDEARKRTLNDKKMHSVTMKPKSRTFIDEAYEVVAITVYLKDKRMAEREAVAIGPIIQGKRGTLHSIVLTIYVDDTRDFVDSFYFYMGDSDMTESFEKLVHNTSRKNPLKIYPNDVCSCGSGKKYKKCCGR